MNVTAVSMALLLAAAVPALADHSPRSLVISDPAGDANSVNDGGEYSFGNRPTQTSRPALDIRKVELAATTDDAETVTGLRLTFTLHAPLEDRTQLTLKTRTATCADILLQYVHGDGEPSGRLSSGCERDVRRLAASVDGTSVTLTVPLAALPAKARADNVLQTVNAGSQFHLTRDPLLGRSVASNLVDTTLDRVTYRLR